MCEFLVQFEPRTCLGTLLLGDKQVLQGQMSWLTGIPSEGANDEDVNREREACVSHLRVGPGDQRE